MPEHSPGDGTSRLAPAPKQASRRRGWYGASGLRGTESGSMLFSMPWFSRRTAVSDAHWAQSLKTHPILAELGHEEAARLRALAEQFLASMQIRFAGKLTTTESRRTSLALLACLPVLNLGLRRYRGWRTVLLVPQDYESPYLDIDEAGVVHEGVDSASGEFLALGTVVFSLRDVAASGKGGGYNVVVHEAAHVLDFAGGSLDGAPPLHEDMDAARWAEVFTAAYEDLQRRVLRRPRNARYRPPPFSGRDARRGRRTAFDPYAAEAPEEFFAVASELFFECPRRLRAEYPEVYRQLALFYRQDRV